MKKKIAIWIIFGLILFILINSTIGLAKNKLIKNIRIGIHEGFRRIAIDVSAIPSYNVEKYGKNLYVVLKDTDIDPRVQKIKYYNDPIIGNYVIKQGKNTTTINFSIKKDFLYKADVTVNPNIVFIDIYPTNIKPTPSPAITKKTSNTALPPISSGIRVSNMILTEKDKWGNGIFNSFFFYFDSDPNWVVKNGKINLVISHSDIVLSSTSSFTVYLNSIPIKSVKLDSSNKLKTNITIDLPINNLIKGTNEILVKAYLRSLADPCQDIDNPGIWFKIHRESIVHLEYILKSNLTIKDYPVPFFEPPLVSPLKSIILLPNKIVPSEIEAAYSIIANWGEIAPYSQFYPVITPLNALTQSDKNKHIIFIGLWDNIPANIRNLIKNHIKTEPLEGKSYIGIIQSPYHSKKRLLYIVGKTSKDIIRGVKALLMVNSRKQLTKNPSVIDSKVVLEEEKVLPFEKDYITFRDLGNDNILLEGAFHQSKHIYYEIPTAWKLKNGAYMKLYFRHAVTLSPVKSILTITLNDTPISSVKLIEKNADGGEVYIPLTKEILRNKYLDIGFDAYLDLDVKDCTRIYPESAWILVKGDSILYLPHTIAPFKFSLKFLPNLYIENQKIDNTHVIFTKTPNRTLFRILGIIIASFGSRLQGFTMPKVEFLEEASNEVIKRIEKQKNIFIGSPRSFLNSLFKNLVFYNRAEDRYISKEYTLIPEYTRNATLIQLTRKNNMPNTIIYETKKFEPSFIYLSALSYWPGFQKLKGKLSLISHSGEVISFGEEKEKEVIYKGKLEKYFDFIQKIGRRRAILSILITLIGLSILFIINVLYRERKNR